MSKKGRGAGCSAVLCAERGMGGRVLCGYERARERCDVLERGAPGLECIRGHFRKWGYALAPRSSWLLGLSMAGAMQRSALQSRWCHCGSARDDRAPDHCEL